MSRFLTIILLLLVFFFGGMSYGAFEKDRQQAQPEPVVEEKQEVEQVNNVMTHESIENELLNIDDRDRNLHKTASFLEKIVTSAYELVIQMMYSIANLFFD